MRTTANEAADAEGIPASLGLVGDLDDVAMIEDVESAFGVRFTAEELASCHTVGDIYRLIVGRLPREGTSGGACATAMSFYRLRAALQHLAPDEPLRPSTPIAVLASLPVRRLHRLIEERAGLRPPHPIMSWQGCVALTLMVAAPLAAYAYGVPLWGAIACAAPPYVLSLLAPIRLPADIKTLGDLAERVAGRSIGKLAEKGARLDEDEAWQALVTVLDDHTDLPPAKITPAALLLRRERRSA